MGGGGREGRSEVSGEEGGGGVFRSFVDTIVVSCFDMRKMRKDTGTLHHTLESHTRAACTRA